MHRTIKAQNFSPVLIYRRICNHVDVNDRAETLHMKFQVHRTKRIIANYKLLPTKKKQKTKNYKQIATTTN